MTEKKPAASEWTALDDEQQEQVHEPDGEREGGLDEPTPEELEDLRSGAS